MLLTWPDAHTDWADCLPAIQQTWLSVIATLAGAQTVYLTVRDRQQMASVREALPAAAQQRLHFILGAYDDTWIRDYGPITVLTDTGAIALDFIFNGWNGRHGAENDNRFNRALLPTAALQLQRRTIMQVLEGGGIESDGSGTVMTTARFVDTRFTHRQSFIDLCRGTFGAQRCMVLEHGHLDGDDTDDHIDMLARFCDAATIAYSAPGNDDDAQTASLAAMRAELQALHSVDGQAYTLLPLPTPAPTYGASGQRLPASYANFLITNRQVLVPQYNDSQDAVALATLAKAFPTRTITPIDATTLITQGGAIHCATMQIPRPR